MDGCKTKTKTNKQTKNVNDIVIETFCRQKPFSAIVIYGRLLLESGVRI